MSPQGVVVIHWHVELSVICISITNTVNLTCIESLFNLGWSRKEKTPFPSHAKVVKMEMARGPPKLCRNKEYFWIFSN